MWHAGLDEAQVGIMISGRNIHNLRYTDDTTPIAEREEELRRLLIKLEEEAEKAGFKLNLQKAKIMAPVRLFHGKQWEKEWKQWETIFGGFKITADGDYRNESKRGLLLGRKAMTNLGNILKSRNITLLTKVHLDKAMVFPVLMYGCESWTTKKAECWRIDAFELWCWRRLLRSPLDYKDIQPISHKINQSRIFIGGTDAEAETPILRLPDANWLTGKDHDAWKDWMQEEEMTEDEMAGWHHWLNGHEFEQTPGVGEGQ